MFEVSFEEQWHKHQEEEATLGRIKGWQERTRLQPRCDL